MRLAVLLAAIAAAALSTGCVTTMGPMSGPASSPEKSNTLAETMAQFRTGVGDVFAGMQAVTLEMDGDMQAFAERQGLPEEIFIRLRPAPRGSVQYKANFALMDKLGSLAAHHPMYETYIYVSPTDFRSPEMQDYVAAIERRAGPRRAMIKADLRMRGSNDVLVWTRDAQRASANDALISAAERGLLAKQ